jgi:SAM-dependent methyltransferase
MATNPVESYFKSVGIGRPKSDAIYVKRGRARFGKAFEALTFLIGERASGAEVDPYELKNQSLDLSLYVGEHHASNMWREFASWVVRESLPPPLELLDIGCENGVLTCFYATLWPDAKVVGIDQSPAAIAAAHQLAKRLNLGNVSFERADGKRYVDANAGRFQIIMATHVMHEFLSRSGSRKAFSWETYDRIEDVVLSDPDRHAIETLMAVAGALAEGGILISLDRSPTLASQWWYTQCLEEAGLKISLSRSSLIECSGPSQVETFPLTVARSARVDEARTTPEEIISLASFKKLSALNLTLDGASADAFIRSVGPKEIVFDAVCTYRNGSGIRTIRLLAAPTLLVLQDFTNHGFHTVWITPLVALPEVLQQCNDIVAGLESHCSVRRATTEATALCLARLDYQMSDESAQAERTGRQ